MGSLGTLPLHFALRALGPIPHALVTLGLTAAGVWAAQRVSDALGEEDPQAVVIDEVAGTLLAMGIARPAGTIGELAAFALFRVLDIKKPGAIDRAQRLQPEGVGIMADDVLAGIGAGVAIRIAARWLR